MPAQRTVLEDEKRAEKREQKGTVLVQSWYGCCTVGMAKYQLLPVSTGMPVVSSFLVAILVPGGEGGGDNISPRFPPTPPSEEEQQKEGRLLLLLALYRIPVSEVKSQTVRSSKDSTRRRLQIHWRQEGAEQTWAVTQVTPERKGKGHHCVA